MKIKNFFVLAMLGLTCFNIRSAKAQPMPKSVMDKWFTPDNRNGYYKAFSPEISFRVRAVRLTRAIEELANVRIKPLENNQASDYIGNTINISKGLKPFLVRGVYFHDGTGGFGLSRKGNDLLVSHVCLGNFAPMKRQPLVVFLNWTPKNVYVEATVAG